MAEASTLEGYYQSYGAQGLIPVTLVFEDNEGNAATQEDAAEWARELSVTHPVLADSAGVGDAYEVDFYIPSLTLLAPGLEIVEKDGTITAEDIEAVLPN